MAETTDTTKSPDAVRAGELRTTTVEDLLRRWPATADVFFRHGMACVGCSMAPFETLPEAAGAYRVPEERFLRDVLRVIAGAPAPPPA